MPSRVSRANPNASYFLNHNFLSLKNVAGMAVKLFQNFFYILLKIKTAFSLNEYLYAFKTRIHSLTSLSKYVLYKTKCWRNKIYLDFIRHQNQKCLTSNDKLFLTFVLLCYKRHIFECMKSSCLVVL